jgi:hypothetical protein
MGLRDLQEESMGGTMDRPMPGVNKRQAVAEAWRELGEEADSPEVVAFTKARFGLLVDAADVARFKGERKRRQGRGTSPVTWEGTSHNDAVAPYSKMDGEPGAQGDLPHTGDSNMPRGRPKKQQPQATKTERANGEAISKLEAVRRSLAELGNDAKPLALQEHLRKTYSIDMEPAYISKYKSLVLRTGKKGKRRGRKPKAEAGAMQQTAAPVARAVTKAGGGISLDDVRVVKELSGRLGADRVCELVDLVAR